MQNEKLRQLLVTEDSHLEKLNNIVLQAVGEEELLSKKLYEHEEENISLGGKLADKVASFGGSWRFIIAFFLFMALWISINLYLMSRPFDVYPFILLNLILSCLAAIQAPIIMMSQNRKEEKDRQRSQNDYLVNLKSEIEIRNLHQKIDLLIAEQMKNLFAVQQEQTEIMEDICERIDKLSGK